MQKRILFKLKILSLLFFCKAGSFYGQAVIGNKNVSAVAQLDLSYADRGLLLPMISITDNSNGLLPIQNPAIGLWFYNKASAPIGQNLRKGTSYWGDGSRYQAMSTEDGIHDVLADSKIPLLVLSAKVGQKATIACGTGACGGSSQKLVPSASEIIIDPFETWMLTSGSYEIIKGGIYVIEYSTDLSNSSNEGGTSSLRMNLNGSTHGFAFGRFVSTMNRAYGTFSTVVEVSEGDVFDFYYGYTANNYRIEEATINIYRY